MQYPDDPWREIARATKQRDWGAVDAVLEDRRLAGSMAVARGYTDARKAAGGDKLQPLDKPAPITIHDLSPEDRARAKIHHVEGYPTSFSLRPGA